MSDDFNFFDDDSLIPDWMRDSASDEPPSPPPQVPTGSTLPPWAKFGGSPPPAPGRAAAVPPWETFQGAAPRPPQASGTLPPWGESVAPPVEEPDESPMPFRGASAEPEDNLAFDWGIAGETPCAPAGELPHGLTGMLPWLEDSQPPAQERGPIRRLSESPTPAQPSAEDAAWLSAFGEAAGYDDAGIPSGEDDDLDWLTGGTSTDDDLAALIFDGTSPAQEEDDLEALIFGAAPAESEPPAVQDEFEALFADEFPEPEPAATPDEEAGEEDDLAWLNDDLGDLPVLAASEPEEPEDAEPAQAVPEWQGMAESEEEPEDAESAQVLPGWLDTAYEEEPEPEPEEAEPLPGWLQADLGEIEEPEALEKPAEEEAPRPAIRRIAPEPPAAEAPRRAIRRIAPQPEEPEIDENDMAAWLARMGTEEPEQSDDAAEMTYEEWERLQAEKEREAQRTEEDRMLEEGPDWFSQAVPDQPAAPAAGTPPSVGGEMVPDWFLGLEQQKAEETPDWFKKLDLSADAMTALPVEPPPTEPEPSQPAAAEAPDWFTGASLSGFEDTDWDAAFGVPSEPEPEEQAPGPIRRITPPVPKPAEEIPDWADDSLWEPPAEPQAHAEEVPMSQDEFDLPEFEPSDELPDWLSESAPEEPAPAEEELPLPTTGMLYGFESAQPEEPEISFDEEFALPDLDLEAGEVAPGEVPDWLSQAAPEEPAPAEEPEIPFGEEFALSDLDWETGEAAPGEVPDWLGQAAPEEPAPAEEPEIPFDEEFALSDLDWETGEAAPGEVSDWLSQAAPEEPAPAEAPEISFDEEFALSDLDWETGETARGGVLDWLNKTAPQEPAEEEELPLPTTGMLYGFESAQPEEPAPEISFDEEIAPGEVPDWLAAEQDARAAPDEVPFPEIGLDDTMPTERADLLGADDFAWMSDFEPGEGLRRPPRIKEEPEDFVERFDPMEPEEYIAPAAPIDDDAPAWLRELAAETEFEDTSLAGEAETSIEPPEEVAIPDFLAAETGMDWLSELSTEDVQPEPAEAKASMPPRPDESIPDLEPGVLHTSPLDSSAIDQLLGLYEGAAAEAEPEELEWELDEVEAPFEARDIETAEPAEAASFEVGGVADWEWMTPGEGEADQVVPDLGALFDEASLGEDMIAAEAEEETQPEHLRPVPEAAPRFRRKKPEPEPEVTPEEPAQPEWLAEMRPSDLPVVVKAGGAETSIKQKQVIELPERLRAFHEKAMNEVRDLYEEKAPAAPADAGPLAGIAGALSVADLVLETGVKPVEGLVVTPEQQDRLSRLQAMLETVAAEEEELEEEKSQIEGLEPIDLEGYEEGEQPAPEVTPKRARRRRRFKLDRVIVGLVMLAALIVPFATDALHIASDPPALKAEGAAVGEAVDTLSAGQYVLVALEYGPTAAGELDPLAEAVLRDVLTKGAIPLTISTDPAGAFHAEAVIAPLVKDTALLGARGQGETALTAGEDYFLLRYLAGEAVGVRSLRTTSKDAQGNYEALDAFKTDLRGDETKLGIGNIQQDLALIVVVGAESDAVRIWAEQLKDVSVLKVALVAASIEPLTVPYVNQDGYAGYLAGVRDTYSYNAARNTTNRTPYAMPDDVPVDIPDPEVSRWHSMALGAAVAASLIALGMVLNLLRGITRRPRR